MGLCMSGDGKLVLWVHACVPRQLARLYNSGVCACFYKACDYCFLCSAWLLCSVTIVAERSWSFSV